MERTFKISPLFEAAGRTTVAGSFRSCGWRGDDANHGRGVCRGQARGDGVGGGMKERTALVVIAEVDNW